MNTMSARISNLQKGRLQEKKNMFQFSAVTYCSFLIYYATYFPPAKI